MWYELYICHSRYPRLQSLVDVRFRVRQFSYPVCRMTERMIERQNDHNTSALYIVIVREKKMHHLEDNAKPAGRTIPSAICVVKGFLIF